MRHKNNILNHKKRRDARIGFISFYGLSILVLAALFYFHKKMPEKVAENYQECCTSNDSLQKNQGQLIHQLADLSTLHIKWAKSKKDRFQNTNPEMQTQLDSSLGRTFADIQRQTTTFNNMETDGNQSIKGIVQASSNLMTQLNHLIDLYKQKAIQEPPPEEEKLCQEEQKKNQMATHAANFEEILEEIRAIINPENRLNRPKTANVKTKVESLANEIRSLRTNSN